MRRTLVTFDIWKDLLNRLEDIEIDRVLIESDDLFVFVIQDNVGDMFTFIDNNLGDFDVRIVRDELGKPRLFDEGGVERHGISWSYSEGRVMIGLRKGGPIGIDLEFEDLSIDSRDVSWVFHPNELLSMGEYGLFDTWVRKESYVKMLGIGLVDDIEEVDSSSAELMSGRFLTHERDFYWSVCLG